jgi:hypothetical protein
MKPIYFVCFLLSLSSFSQETKRASDTIYIYYDAAKAKSSKIKSQIHENKQIVECYLIGEDGRKIYIRAQKSKREKKECKTKFLEKHTENTISFRLLENNGIAKTLFEIFEVTRSRKTYFLVTNKSKRAVIIQKANISYPDFIIM